MMADDNSMVALATPTRFLIENGEWNLTPSLDVHHEINPFDCNFQRTPKPAELPPLTKPNVYESQIMYTTSPEPEMTLESIHSPPTPPMSVSQSPSSSSFSLSSTSSSDQATDNSYTQHYTSKVVAPHHTTLHPSSTQNYMEESNRRSSRIQSAKQSEKPSYPQPQKTNSSGRKRRILFEGEDAEDRRKKFLERNRVAAYKCRQKKKNWMLELEQKAEIQNNQNEELRALVAQLKEESMYLRNLLLTHGNCDCESVQAYLRKTSVDITNNTSPLGFRRDSSASFYPPSNFNTMPSFSTTSTGLTPFLNTVINKESSGNEPNDYFSQSHVKS
ncbi:uncharacterized protein B0P05DRAFT_562127 [Gilbertella persicaria]|uniref:uncharacterized protein n=1 Tax=Gilbertella persicaria TaxID=101096 RepID=UPI0022211091|nr:uncharacterized protein B0P05DRAFT_562127 [Gilbertella persicaria]KAI8052600.1 hypothetical protein B0P05DRAFT_562127 [Gilbertella persicaria]